MLKIDKIDQHVNIEGAGIISEITTEDYTLTPISENEGLLKTNPGKTLDIEGLNLGATPQEAEEITEAIMEGLKVKLINNTGIEYCLDTVTDFKLIENKYILKTFLQALAIHNYRTGKLDFEIEVDKGIAASSWKGLKGYKKSRALKLYSKFEEKGIEAEGDYIRLELIYGARVIEQNNINKISDVKKAKQELKEFLNTWESLMPTRGNHHTKPAKTLIEVLKKTDV